MTAQILDRSITVSQNDISSNCQVCDEDIYYHPQLHKWMMKIQESQWDDYNDDFFKQMIEINYCYSCGKNYKDVSPT